MPCIIGQKNGKYYVSYKKSIFRCKAMLYSNYGKLYYLLPFDILALRKRNWINTLDWETRMKGPVPLRIFFVFIFEISKLF